MRGALKRANDNGIDFNLENFGEIFSVTSKACRLWSLPPKFWLCLLPKVICHPGKRMPPPQLGPHKSGAKDSDKSDHCKQWAGWLRPHVIFLLIIYPR